MDAGNGDSASEVETPPLKRLKTCVGPFPPDSRDRVHFAVPKKGRLFEHVVKLLKGSGLDFKRPDRVDVAQCRDLPVVLVFLPASDIPKYVGEGNVDLGITGVDVLQEDLLGEIDGTKVEQLLELPFGGCRLCVQAPEASAIKDPAALAGKRIVTSFPNLTRQYFEKFDRTSGRGATKVRCVSGSVEAACELGLADGIVDLVETGTTMRAAKLEVVAEVLQSTAVLIRGMHEADAKRRAAQDEVVSTIVRRIRGWITATAFVMVQYNVHSDYIKACCAITPGKRSPTMTKLAEEHWHAVSALVTIADSNKIMDRLIDAGAKDILCFSLTNTRMG